MKIDHGPPGATGVKSLQYVGDDADYSVTTLGQIAKPAGKLAVAVWAYAWITGNRSLKLVATGVGIGALLIQLQEKTK